MAEANKYFVEFSKPFIDALKSTLSMMAQTEITAHTPQIKQSPIARGDITAIIGMNGTVANKECEKVFKGLLVISWPEPIYMKIASRMLFEEYDTYTDEIADVGGEIVNIVMGNAKRALAGKGYQIEMATPSMVRGKDHTLKYPPNTTVVEMTISSDIGDFSLELCYQENQVL